MKIIDRFNRDTEHHQLTVLHDEGLYKHLRFIPVHPDPTKRSSWMWFDIVTWPHNLAFRGDIETLAWSRIEDMLGFFRDSAWKRRPNLHYWAEKLTTDRDSVLVYDEQLMRNHINDAVHDSGLVGLAEAVQTDVLDALSNHEHSDRDIVSEFTFYTRDDDRYAYPKPDPDFIFDDLWEWNLRDYSWVFQWACCALIWGEEYYRTGNRPEPLSVPKPDPEPAAESDAGTEPEPRGIAAGTARRRPVEDVQLPEPEGHADA